MRRKKLAIYISLIVVFILVLTLLPLQAIYADPQALIGGGNHLVPCGTNKHSIKYNVEDGEKNAYTLGLFNYQPKGWNENSKFYAVEWENKRGVVTKHFLRPVGCHNRHFGAAYYLEYCVKTYVRLREKGSSGPPQDILWIKFYYTGDVADCEDGEDAEVMSTRTQEMTANQVWVNEAGCFEFVFWYEYASNNWVKIYDMSGVEVFSIDMTHGKANFEACLPDGMYTVKTFHNGFEKPIQEFVIGKP